MSSVAGGVGWGGGVILCCVFLHRVCAQSCFGGREERGMIFVFFILPSLVLPPAASLPFQLPATSSGLYTKQNPF